MSHWGKEGDKGRDDKGQKTNHMEIKEETGERRQRTRA